MDAAIRIFLAIALPDTVHRRLDEIQRGLKAAAGERAARAVRWSPAGNMHLTLKFLGEVSAANVQTLTGMLRKEAVEHSRFTVRFAELGAFPNPRRPRVLWVGADAPPELLRLQKAIESETRLMGYPAEERPFSPHLTLGRVSASAHADDVAAIARAIEQVPVGEVGTVDVDAIHLYRSDLRPSGAVYSVLETFKMGA
jgi:2'-5' RNA ligase